MRRFLAVLGLALCLIAGAPLFVLAQTPCGPADKIVATVTGAPYGEAMAIELRDDATSLRLFLNPQTQTWTVVAFQPGGLAACVMAAGKAFHFIDETPEPQPRENKL